MPPPEARLLSSLLPKAVRESLSQFGKEATALLSSAEQEAKDASKDARQQLSAVGLPGSLEVRGWHGGRWR